MANELILPPGSAPTGSGVYALVFDSAGLAWNGSAFATFTSTRADFDVAMTEVSGTGEFRGDMPGSAGQRIVVYFLIAAGVGQAPSAANDIRLGTVIGYWDATSFPATLSAAQVNAEVVDALVTDTYAEPGQGAPAATASLAAKIGYLFKAWRNKHTQTSDTYKLFADDGTTVDQKAASMSDDGTTFTRTEVGAGP